MALPQPTVLVREVEELEARLQQLLSDYRWAHTMAFGIRGAQPDTSTDPVVGQGPKGGKAATPGRTRESMSWSDPTGDAVADRERIRSQMGKAAGALRRARKHIEIGLEEIGRVFADRRDRYPSPPGPRTVTRAEVRESVEAKHRRQGRGEGWGEA